MECIVYMIFALQNNMLQFKLMEIRDFFWDGICGRKFFSVGYFDTGISTVFIFKLRSGTIPDSNPLKLIEMEFVLELIMK